MLPIGLLSSMVQAILPGKIQLRFLQQEQISSVKKDLSYQGYVILWELKQMAEMAETFNSRNLR